MHSTSCRAANTAPSPCITSLARQALNDRLNTIDAELEMLDRQMRSSAAVVEAKEAEKKAAREALDRHDEGAWARPDPL